MPTSSSRREVDAYANIPSVVANSSIPGCVESVKPDGVSLGSGLLDQELATDCEISGNENEHMDSDSSIDNNLDHLCNAKSTEFKLKDNIPGFEYISETDHHGWAPVRVQRVGTRETEFDAAFLEVCEEVSFLNVGGSLKAKVSDLQLKLKPYKCNHFNR